MASNEDDQITQVVLDFLKTADMAVTTERTVLAHVQKTQQLERPVSEYKRLVSSTIDKFLESLDDEEASGKDGGSDAEDEPDAGGAKRGRKRAGGGATKAAASKKARSGGSEEVLFSLDLSSRRKARVRRWEGKVYVDVREFYKVDGADAPTQKGLSMDPGQWARLARDLPQLVTAQKAQDASAPASQVSKTRLAAVSEFKGTYYLGLREYYEKDGQLAPTKKGLNLNLAESEALLAASADITAAAGGIVEAPPLTETPLPLATSAGTAASGAGGSAHNKAEAPSHPAPAAAAPPRPSKPAAAASGAGDDVEAQEVVELGSNKRLSISRFQGRLSVDLREFYEKAGELFPGKKGIALSPADWTTLNSHLGDINDALGRRDMSYSLQLSGMRRVSLSEFKGVLYVAVREYYDKGGDLAPTQKGLNMNPQQWAACIKGAPGITAALERAQHGAL